MIIVIYIAPKLMELCNFAIFKARDNAISSASHYLSGFCHCFINFVKITLKPITAADRRSFSAVEKGNIWLYLPNVKEKASQVYLKDILYALAMGVTLVTISCIALAGSTVVFTGNTCQIFNNKRKVIGTIQMNSGLYQVFLTCPLKGEYAEKQELRCQLMNCIVK